MLSERPVVVILIGPPGSGKGTQSARLSAALTLPKISTGDILRSYASNEGPLSEKLSKILASGALVPDDILASIITERLSCSDCENGFILDGYPRNLDQAIFLEKLLTKKGSKLIVIEIVVPESVLVKRVTGRFSCKSCGAIYNQYFAKPKLESMCDQCGGSEFYYRVDDKESVILERLKSYSLQTLPLVDFYSDQDALCKIDGNQNFEDVYKDILSCIYKKVAEVPRDDYIKDALSD